MPDQVRWKVLVSAPRAIEQLQRYRESLGAAGCEIVACSVVERLEEADLLPLVPDVHGIVCGDDRITERVLEAAPRLRVIAKWGTGMDSIDLAAAARRGVVVRNVPDAFSEPVADTVMGYILLFARRLDVMNAYMQAGHWARIPLRSLAECTLGIVGFGHCGRAVARRATAFGMRLLAYDPVAIPDDLATSLHVRPTSLDEVLSGSDFVTLHATLHPGSYHLLNAARLALLKPSAVLINTARGPLVDEVALVAALRAGQLAGAALDVFEHEPLPADSPLRGLPNVYLAPHNANASPAAAERVHAATIQHVLTVLGASPR